MKVVYNNCYGGFSLSHEGIMRYGEIKGLTLYPEKGEFGSVTYWTCPPDKRPATLSTEEFMKAPIEERKASNAAHSANTLYSREIDRADPALVQVVEELGKKANGQCANLAIEDVPPGTMYRIDEYDGNETVATQDSYEWKVAS